MALPFGKGWKGRKWVEIRIGGTVSSSRFQVFRSLRPPPEKQQRTRTNPTQQCGSQISIAKCDEKRAIILAVGAIFLKIVGWIESAA
jgi:hypothetical protein